MPWSVHIYIARFFEACGAVEVFSQSEDGGEEGVKRAEDRGPLLAGVHVDAAVPEPAAGRYDTAESVGG